MSVGAVDDSALFVGAAVGWVVKGGVDDSEVLGTVFGCQLRIKHIVW